MKQAAVPAVAPEISNRPSFSNDEISRRIQNAVLEHRLAPGTKLVEERLAEISGVSRTKIREVLGKLAHEGLVTLIPNRGAFIASPSAQQARDVFVTRRMIEPEMARQLANTITTPQLRALRRHVRQEGEARRRGEMHAVIRLSGEFHVLFAQMHGNEILLRLLRELTPLTCLVITLYDKPNVPACPHHEHDALIDALEARDGERAAAIMLEHLRHIEATLSFDAPATAAVDIEAIFS
ncbi:GntR family transcriptional regulator [Pandoraea thiooxydans]|uniref:GntR family transcriptional regulator n=1 Tax=Pandoraea thiooxydans TaxID=445709 RepID=UPI00094A3A0C|nr:GntR family transcriptional regulator [Pandoraea thiooxydans]APR94569.1 GntR family transcriptional regulator [Pandoraea thiooxydans]